MRPLQAMTDKMAAPRAAVAASSTYDFVRGQVAFSAIREVDAVISSNSFDLAPEFLYARAKAHASA